MGGEHETDNETDLLLLCPASACCYLSMGTGRAGGKLFTEQVPGQPGAWLMGIQTMCSFAECPSVMTS